MEKRIQLERRGVDASVVKELNLDNCRSAAIVGLTDEYVNLETLSLINVGLLSLKGFPTLPKLRRLELSDNRISQELDRLKTSPNLTYLNLSGNKIADMATLEPLKEFKKLKNLDLFNNDVTAVDDYRVKVFELIPSLKYLDGFDKDDCEADDTDAEDEEPNGNNESSDDEVSEEEEEEEGEMSLRSLYNDKLEAEGSGSDYMEEEEEGDEEEWDGEEGEDGKEGENPTAEAEESTRGKKRKHEDGGGEPNN